MNSLNHRVEHMHEETSTGLLHVRVPERQLHQY